MLGKRNVDFKHLDLVLQARYYSRGKEARVRCCIHPPTVGIQAAACVLCMFTHTALFLLSPNLRLNGAGGGRIYCFIVRSIISYSSQGKQR